MEYAVIDAFSQRAFSGNPAAVCLPGRALPDQVMQQLAAEFNLSETAFVLPRADNRWWLRWFTPRREVNLCGHATMAAGHFLFSHLGFTGDEVTFDTRSGPLTLQRAGRDYQLEMPRCECSPLALEALPPALADGAIAAATAGEDWLVELASAAQLQHYSPPLACIAELSIRGLIVTASADNGDIVSRFFAPAIGIDEDPVTGAAHCALADYWWKRRGIRQFHARQLSPRGGELAVVTLDTRVRLIGSAVTVMSGSVVDRWLT